eukprot:scaffold133_cov407-Prasinococcus_capsulatus_cf.AAC.8
MQPPPRKAPRGCVGPCERPGASPISTRLLLTGSRGGCGAPASCFAHLRLLRVQTEGHAIAWGSLGQRKRAQSGGDCAHRTVELLGRGAR